MNSLPYDIVRLQGDDFAPHRNHWESVVRDPGAGFRFQGAGSAHAAEERSLLSAQLSATAAEQVNRLSGGRPLETAVVLLSAFAGIVSRYADTDRLTLHTLPYLTGNGSAPRQSLPLTWNLQGTEDLKAMLIRTDEVVKAAFQFQALPLQALYPGQVPASNLLWIHGPLHGQVSDAEKAAYDLVWEMGLDDSGALSLEVSYRSGAFASWFIGDLIDNFSRWLSQFQDLQQPLATLDFLAPEQRKLVAETYVSGGDLPEGRRGSLIAHFEQHALETPDRIAVRDRNQSYTFAQLDRVSDNLAAELRNAMGVVPGDRVAILLDRSVEFYIGILAAWKARAAYVPIDPVYPEKRIHHILDDAAPKVLLTHSDHLMQMLEVGADIFAMDLQLEGLADAANELRDHDRSDDLAYLIYTSGSTGQPKGVRVNHRALEVIALDQCRRLGLHAEDNILQFFSFAFDASLHRIGTAMVSGARLTLVEEAVTRNPSQLSRLIAEQGVTVASFPSAYLPGLDEQALPSVRIMTAGADSVPPEDARRFALGKDFYNVYGPTECTVLSTCYQVDPQHVGKRLPIGRPLSGEQVWVLDRRMQMLPVGAEGDLYIAGAGLAEGYWNDPGKTEAAFLPHPFQPGARIYRTGDRARWLNDGNLEFLGRKDQQVKVRGYRIETGEIESAILEYKGIRQVTVRAIDAGNEKQLAAWLVADGDIDRTELEGFLGQHLPAYMVPAHICQIAEMPLTSHGKIDVPKLPAPMQVAEKAAEEILPDDPRTARLLEIWKAVLGMDNLSSTDDFFVKGGDSIRAIQLVTRINQAFGLHIEVSLVFDHPSPAQMAPVIEGILEDENGSGKWELPENSPGMQASVKYWDRYLGSAKTPQKTAGKAHNITFALDPAVLAMVRDKLNTGLLTCALAALEYASARVAGTVAVFAFAARRTSRYEPGMSDAVAEFPFLPQSGKELLPALIRTKDTVAEHRLQPAPAPQFTSPVEVRPAGSDEQLTVVIHETSDRVREWEHALHEWTEQIVPLVKALPERTWTRSDFPLLDLREEDLARLPQDTEDAYPLADIQYGMVFHSLRTPETGLYRKQNVLSVSDPDFDQDLIFAALNQVAARHEVLRTCFLELESGDLIQLVRRGIHFAPDVDDLSGSSREVQDQAIREYLEQDRRSGIQFRSGLQYDLKVFRLAAGNHLLVLSMHHAIEDGWSFGNFAVEWLQAYGHLAKGEDQILPPLAHGYKTFIRSQRWLMDAGEAARYWETKLENLQHLPAPQDLFPGEEISGKASLSINLDAALSQILRRHGEQNQQTLFNMATAAYAWFLHCVTGAEQVSFGYVTHSRPPVEDGDKIFGCFLNTVPIQVDLSDVHDLAGLCEKVAEQLRENRRHEGYPYSRMMENADRSQAGPLYETFFGFTDIYATEPLWESGDRLPLQVGPAMEYIDERGQGTNTPLSLVLDHTEQQFTVMVQFDSTRYSETTARHFADLYASILAGIPDSWSEELAIANYSPAIPERLIRGPVCTASPTDIVTRFREWAQKTPGATALRFQERSYSYAELDDLSSRLASYLSDEFQLKEKSLVGIMTPRSPELIIGMLAVLKAGFGYVPLAADLPQERLGRIIEDAGVGALLINSSQMFDLQSFPTQLFAMDIQLDMLEAPEVKPESVPQGGDTAYVLYTSGSTGQPKGVVISRQSPLALRRLGQRSLFPGWQHRRKLSPLDPSGFRPYRHLDLLYAHPGLHAPHLRRANGGAGSAPDHLATGFGDRRAENDACPPPSAGRTSAQQRFDLARGRRRRSPLFLAGPGPVQCGSASTCLQRIRPHRSHGRLHCPGTPARGPGNLHRPTHPGHGSHCAQRTRRIGAHGRPRRTLPRRTGPGAGLSEPSRCHRPAICTASTAPRQQGLPNRGPRTLPEGRFHRVPGPGGRPTEGPRLPGGARRDRAGHPANAGDRDSTGSGPGQRRIGDSACSFRHRTAPPECPVAAQGGPPRIGPATHPAQKWLADVPGQSQRNRIDLP